MVAAQLIELAGDPNAGVAEIYEVLKIDPALSSRLLRLANSPLYAWRRRTESVPQAIMKLGVDAVITAALGLTLLSQSRQPTGGRLSFERRWSRSVHAAVTAQLLANHTRCARPADAFLAAIVQDIGVLVINQLVPETYARIDDSSTEAEVIAAEIDALGVDHGAIGAELLDAWRLPDHIVRAVARSHEVPEMGEPLVAMNTIGEHVAEWLAGDPDGLTIANSLAASTLGLDDVGFSTVLSEVAAALPDLTELLQADLPADDVLMEMATDAIIERQLRQQQAVTQLRDDLETLRRTTAELEHESRSDPVTGLSNRRMIERVLEQEHELALGLGSPLSLLFIDLDNFKSVNETYGHHGGDDLLVQVARRLLDNLRASDYLGRWGGDEFVIVLPGASLTHARAAANRLLEAIRATTFDLQGRRFAQHLSVGVACTDQLDAEHTVEALVMAADAALFEAKNAGKNGFRAYSDSTPVS